tara:strand:+ start:540 stop:1421 length:882 start_codon:yes stop_codon:yes gene_type:complete
LGYDPFGRGHRGARRDEDRFHTWLNSGGHEHFDWGGEIFDHAEVRGGTKKIEDVVAIMESGREIKFSNKQAKSGVESHSHTWKNNSRTFTQLRKEGSTITQPFTDLIEFRDRQVEQIPNFRDRLPNREMYDTRMKAAHQKVRDNLTEELIEEIFQDQLTHATKGADWVVISDWVREVYYWYRPYHHPIAEATALNYRLEFRRLPGRRKGNESGNLYLIMESGEKVDLKLRMRVKHNNGVRDFFKMGSAAEKKGRNAGGGVFVSTMNQDPGSIQMILELIDQDGNLHGAAFALD